MSVNREELNKMCDIERKVASKKIILEIFPDYFMSKFEKIEGMSEWQAIRYDCQSDLAKVPDDKKGVYAFVYARQDRQLPPNNYIMYIGASLRGKSSLKKRYQSYLNTKQVKRRKNIARMISKCYDALYFYFSTADANIDIKTLKLIEKNFNTIFSPPFAIRDCHGKLKNARSAF